MSIYWPSAPHRGGSLTKQITERNYRRSSLLRRFDSGVLSLVSVVKHRYFDRGAGGSPGGGCGAWIDEGYVWLRPYPLSADDETSIPPIQSAAGWGWRGTVTTDAGLTISTYETESEYLQGFQEAFWSNYEAIQYANSIEGTLIADHSEIVDPRPFRRLKRAA